MDKELLKTKAVMAIESRKDELISIGRELYAIPETGFKEYKTSSYVNKILVSLGLDVQEGLALTGLKAVAKGKEHQFNVAVMGELDSLLMPQHPHAYPSSGAAHACGHHAQLTCLIGVAFGLVGTEIISQLDGDLTLLAVPAEELIELSFRTGLISESKIQFFGGKQEFIRLGIFDDIDAVLCSHITASVGPYFDYSKSYNGVLYKTVRFIGKSSHAALSPHLGVNALHAAICAINNINLIRDTLEEKDKIRIHYIITKGGDSLNIIPDDVRMELGIRAITIQAMIEANKKVNRALRMGAEAVGAEVEIEDQGVYLPLHQDRPLSLVYAENARRIAGNENVIDLEGEVRGSSTDAGDLASIRPTIHPNFGGACGSPHTNEFDICDEYLAYVQPAKVAAMTVIDLLFDGAAEGKRIKESFIPMFVGKEEYCDFFANLKEESC